MKFHVFVAFILFLQAVTLNAQDTAKKLSASERATKRCANPPYVSCAVCSTSPWPVSVSVKKANNTRTPMANNKRDLSLYNVGTPVYYKEKNASYSLVGNMLVQCLPNGSWSQAPKCEFYCTKMPQVVNATCSNVIRFKAGEKASCQCLSGYVRKTGFAQPICKKNEQWSTPLVCKPIPSTETTCIILPQVYRATCKSLVQGKTVWQKGEGVECQCEQGYANYAVSNGFRGLRAETNTRSLARTTKGAHRSAILRTDGAVYKKNATCNGKDKWSNLLVCQPITTTTTTKPCPNPPVVANAGCDGCENHDNTQLTFLPGDSVAFDCRPGYSIQGNPVIKCLSTGQWSKSPTCTKDTIVGCKGLPVIAHGVCERDSEEEDEDDTEVVVPRGQTVTCQCDEDDASTVVTCQRNDTWSKLPTCTISQKATCLLSSLGNPANGYCQSALFDGAIEFDHGEKATCQCDSGFKMAQGGNTVISCNQNGTWSSSKPACIATETKTCDLPDIDNGYCDGSDISAVGGTVVCKCNPRYQLSTDEVVKCTADGAWSVLPKCLSDSSTSAYDCPLPVNLLCDGVSNGGVFAGDAVSGCKCKTGYSLKNSSSPTSMTCKAMANGSFKWSATLECISNSTTPQQASATTTASSNKAWINDAVCGKRKSNTLRLRTDKSLKNLVPLAELQKRREDVAKGRTTTKSTNSSNRIVNGQNAYINEFPWQVRLEINGFLCGGSLINHEWVLTAAHCISPDNTKGEMADVYLGAQAIYTSLPDEILMKASKMIQHPHYDDNTSYNDIALIKLSKPVEFTDKIRPICLLDSCDGEAAVGSSCVISGWGTTEEDGYASDILQKALVPIVTKDECQRALTDHGESDILNDGMTCAGYITGGTDTCQGDSGGPLACHPPADSNTYYLHGATSYGYGCARPGLYGVYSRPCYFMDWIKTVIDTNKVAAVNGGIRNGAKRTTAARRKTTKATSLRRLNGRTTTRRH